MRLTDKRPLTALTSSGLFGVFRRSFQRQDGSRVASTLLNPERFRVSWRAFQEQSSRQAARVSALLAVPVFSYFI